MRNKIIQGDIRKVAKTLESQSVHCMVTSPPYWKLRDYGIEGQFGMEETPEKYVENLVAIFRELKRVLRDDGTLFLNLGDSYVASAKGSVVTKNSTLTGSRNYESNSSPPNLFDKTSAPNLKPKDLVGIPWRVAFALQADGWYLRNDIIWAKLNGLPESVTDRCTKMHEYLFLLTKSPKYYFDHEAIKEPNADPNRTNWAIGKQYQQNEQFNQASGDNHRGLEQTEASGRNKRTVWHVNTEIDPLLQYLITQLETDNPELLQQYLTQYDLDSQSKSTIWSLPVGQYKEAHFAVMPMDLVRPCIKAGCPAKTCSKCGAPWVRITQKVKGVPSSFNGSSFNRGKTHDAQAALSTVGQPERTVQTKLLGFQPTCDCQANTVPGLVFDPFAGSGTVAKVAIEQNKDWSGCELNAEYTELINKRLHATQRELF